MFEQAALNLPQSICNEFRIAIQRGCWENGVKLSDFHIKICEQALFYREGLKDLSYQLQ